MVGTERGTLVKWNHAPATATEHPPRCATVGVVVSRGAVVDVCDDVSSIEIERFEGGHACRIVLISCSPQDPFRMLSLDESGCLCEWEYT
jgi:hypothetical protein